jgi:hypothetical protein
MEDTYILQNSEGVKIFGTVTGPGTWCYIRKNGKKGKVTQVYDGAMFSFNNYNFPDIKAYEITGKFEGLQQTIASGEVHKLPIEVAKSETSIYKDEITLLKNKIDELTSRCDKLEAALGSITSLQPNTPKKKPRRRRSKKSFTCFDGPTSTFVPTEIEVFTPPIPPVSEDVLFNCVESDSSAYWLEKEVIPEYDESLIDELLRKLSNFVRGVSLENIIPDDLVRVGQCFITNASLENKSQPLSEDVGSVFLSIFRSHHVPIVVGALYLAKDMVPHMVKAYYATYLKYLTDCKELKKHPFDDTSLILFINLHFKKNIKI